MTKVYVDGVESSKFAVSAIYLQTGNPVEPPVDPPVEPPVQPPVEPPESSLPDNWDFQWGITEGTLKRNFKLPPMVVPAGRYPRGTWGDDYTDIAVWSFSLPVGAHIQFSGQTQSWGITQFLFDADGNELFRQWSPSVSTFRFTPHSVQGMSGGSRYYYCEPDTEYYLGLQKRVRVPEVVVGPGPLVDDSGSLHTLNISTRGM